MIDADVCSCVYCRYYIGEIKDAYPELAVYLGQLGIDIEKPFETIHVDTVNRMMFYSGVQYVVFGNDERFEKTSFSSVQVFIADSHPMIGKLKTILL